MEINKFLFTNIYSKNESDGNISIVFFNRSNPAETLVFTRFSFYLINTKQDINLDGFSEILPIENTGNQTQTSLYVKGITATELNDIVYIKLSNDCLIVLFYTLDNISGDSFQYFKIITEKSKNELTPLGISEYEKFNKDFDSENHFDVLDLRFG